MRPNWLLPLMGALGVLAAFWVVFAPRLDIGLSAPAAPPGTQESVNMDFMILIALVVGFIAIISLLLLANVMKQMGQVQKALEGGGGSGDDARRGGGDRRVHEELHALKRTLDAQNTEQAKFRQRVLDRFDRAEKVRQFAPRRGAEAPRGEPGMTQTSMSASDSSLIAEQITQMHADLLARGDADAALRQSLAEERAKLIRRMSETDAHLQREIKRINDRLSALDQMSGDIRTVRDSMVRSGRIVVQKGQREDTTGGGGI